MLNLVKIEDQTGYCREIYKDKNTGREYCRHLNDRVSKGVYVNHWNTFNGEPDCPLKDGTEIEIGSELFIIYRDQFTDWAIEKEDCYRPNEQPYPLCKGNSTDDCRNCCRYENMDEYYI